eukprot:4712477-Alexandrium_andersonii.AAC.1
MLIDDYDQLLRDEDKARQAAHEAALEREFQEQQAARFAEQCFLEQEAERVRAGARATAAA